MKRFNSTLKPSAKKPNSRFCKLLRLCPKTLKREKVESPINQEITKKLLEFKEDPFKSRWGQLKMYHCMRNVHQFMVNKKRVSRLYREQGLNLKVKTKLKINRERPEKLSPPNMPTTVLSLDFLHDNLQDGRSIRILNIQDDHNRENLHVVADISLTSKRVILELEKLIEQFGQPQAIRMDNYQWA